MTQKRSVDTRNKILIAARDLFSRQGYEKTSVALICDTAQISKGSFYHHFDSKHEVFDTILDSWLAEIKKSLTGSVDSTNSIPDGIMTMTGSFTQIMKESEGYLPLFLEFWLSSVRDPEIWERTNAPYFSYVEFFKQLMDAGVKEGSIQVENTTNTSFTLIALAFGLLLQNMMNPGAQDWSKISKESFTIFLKGIRRSEL